MSRKISLFRIFQHIALFPIYFSLFLEKNTIERENLSRGIFSISLCTYVTIFYIVLSQMNYEHPIRAVLIDDRIFFL